MILKSEQWNLSLIIPIREIPWNITNFPSSARKTEPGIFMTVSLSSSSPTVQNQKSNAMRPVPAEAVRNTKNAAGDNP